MYRALIVEDEDLMREYLAAKLNALCPEWVAAATAADGMEAVERMAHERFDAVLTDIRMPGMDGLELARYIRRNDAEMPILILSGHDEFDYARSAVRLNVFDYLLKPLNEVELSAALSAMALQVAARQGNRTNGLLFAALYGDETARLRLDEHLAGKPCGLLLFSPALSPDREAQCILLKNLQENANAFFAPYAAPLPHGVAALCTADDPLLVETECRQAAQHFARAYPVPTLHCGYAAFAINRIQPCRTNAEAAVRLALALNEPLLSEHLLYGQRQAQARLDAMLCSLNTALANGTLAEECRASLLAALIEYPPKAQRSVSLSLLYDCDADEALRRDALYTLASAVSPEAQQAPSAQTRFSHALDLLFTDRNSGVKSASVLVQQAREFLQFHFAEPVSLAALADRLGITYAYLSTLFHREMGLSYSQYLLQLRMEDAARRLLGDPAARIHDIGDAVGFPSAKHFTHVFGQYFRISPKEYRESKGKR